MNIEPLMEPELKAAFTAMPYLGDLTEDLAATRRMVVEMVAAARAQSPRNDQVTIEDGSIPGPKGAPNVPVRVYTPSTRTGALPGLYGCTAATFRARCRRMPRRPERRIFPVCRQPTSASLSLMCSVMKALRMPRD
jgi:hypothetical protein